MRLVVLGLLVAGLASASAARLAAVGGTYDSNWGPVTLVQQGGVVTGTYPCCGTGKLTGTLTGTELRYHWDSGGGSGNGIWRVDPRTGRLDGTWGWGASDRDGGPWNLTPPKQAIAN